MAACQQETSLNPFLLNQPVLPTPQPSPPPTNLIQFPQCRIHLPLPILRLSPFELHKEDIMPVSHATRSCIYTRQVDSMRRENRETICQRTRVGVLNRKRDERFPIISVQTRLGS